MSRVNEIKGYIREQQAKIDRLGISDKVLLGCMVDELKQEHGIETIIGKMGEKKDDNDRLKLSQ